MTDTTIAPPLGVPAVDELVDGSTACRWLGVTPARLVELVNAGVVPAYRIGAFVRFRPSDLLAVPLPPAASGQAGSIQR